MIDEAPRKKRSWLPIVLGVVVLLLVVAAGGCFVAISLFRQNMTVTDIGTTGADAEFEKVRARFAGQKPLIQLVDGRPQFVAERTAPESSTPLKTMHVIAWDHDDEKLVRFSLPFWLLRLQSGPIRLSAYTEGWDDRGFSFRVEDIERYGPGLLLDVSEEREGRVMVWME